MGRRILHPGDDDRLEHVHVRGQREVDDMLARRECHAFALGLVPNRSDAHRDRLSVHARGRDRDGVQPVRPAQHLQLELRDLDGDDLHGLVAIRPDRPAHHGVLRPRGHGDGERENEQRLQTFVEHMATPLVKRRQDDARVDSRSRRQKNRL